MAEKKNQIRIEPTWPMCSDGTRLMPGDEFLSADGTVARADGISFYKAGGSVWDADTNEKYAWQYGNDEDVFYRPERGGADA